MKKATSQRYVHLVQTISLGKRKANSSFWTAGHKDYVGEVKHLILKDRWNPFKELAEKWNVWHESCQIILKNHFKARKLTARIRLKIPDFWANLLPIV